MTGLEVLIAVELGVLVALAVVARAIEGRLLYWSIRLHAETEEANRLRAEGLELDRQIIELRQEELTRKVELRQEADR